MVPPCVSKDFSQQTYCIKCQKITSLSRVFRCAFHKNALFPPSKQRLQNDRTEASFTINRSSVRIKRSLCFTIFLQRVPHKNNTCQKQQFTSTQGILHPNTSKHAHPFRIPATINLLLDKIKKQNIICKKWIVKPSDMATSLSPKLC